RSFGVCRDASQLAVSNSMGPLVRRAISRVVTAPAVSAHPRPSVCSSDTLRGSPLDSQRDDVMLQRTRTHRSICNCVAVLCTAALLPGQSFATTLAASPAQAEPQAAASEAAPVSVPPEQLDSLVAPVALYPDPVLAQVLAASTYPLELLQLQQWLQKNPGLKDKALLEAV